MDWPNHGRPIDQFFKLYGQVKQDKWVAFCIKYLEYGLKNEEVVALLNELWLIPPSELPPKLTRKVKAALKRIPDAYSRPS
jgi:hypothetical protein